MSWSNGSSKIPRARGIFDDLTDEFPIVECKILDYRTNGQYFDGEKVYELVNDRFDVNALAAKFAVGTGVIVICVVLNIATAGATTPVACFIAGAADGAVSYAIKGAAFGAAMGAIKSAIKANDFDEFMYGTLDGTLDGYMWGAMYGAITGGMSSEFCFTEDTLVTTQNGLVPISQLSVGDQVYSYDENTASYGYCRATQITTNTANQVVELSIGDDTIRSTPNHPYLTSCGWIEAKDLTIGNCVLSADNSLKTVKAMHLIDCADPVTTYNICVDKNHTYLVGKQQLVVHNRCKMNEKYADKTYKFPEGSVNAAKYPEGVYFTPEGYPDFSKYAQKVVKFDYPSLEGKAAGTCLTGNCSTDFKLANKMAGFKETPAGFTWHHKEDMMTMELVPQDLHSVAFGGVAHNGGESLLRDFWATLFM